jgi:quercetin dioxygenase-like cupin family protein
MTNQIDAFAQDAQTSETLWCLGELQHVLAGGERTGDAFSVVAHEAEEGHATPWHRQPGDDETFYVLEGEIDFWVEEPGQSPQRARAGALVLVPRGTPHAFRIASPSARWLTLHTPAGHERFYRASGEPAPRAGLPSAAEPDMAAVLAAGREHGVELLGPPPGSTR